MKTATKAIDFKDDGEFRQWQDDETNELSVEVVTPFDGFTDWREVKRLGQALLMSAERMKKLEIKSES